MYLIDTNVVSEARKGTRADRGVRRFFDEVAASGDSVYLSSITVGELRRGVEAIRQRGEGRQAALLEGWLSLVLEQYRDNVLDFDVEAAQVWGRLCVPRPEHAIDEQIAAVALVNDLTVVTRNTSDFDRTGVRFVDPFEVRE
ncbi:MAG: type II toxin-antitoxin system VapC family toxin [Aquamicrobium sp.]|uniref:type II toxin-antitoxin system VapC family toxin n=1 Tax=Aquamicrobium sp. TaxID=1872579 RepID=UPI00349EEF68|nr:type II toxin-antitoxin system VapC family toxin [Burkholderiaceae bacterium]MCO5148080.1 type II toxin-antitoxin system VapC family toxin [Aquamicrobium sp.]